MTPFFASSPQDLPDSKTVLSMSGLDFMRAILVGDLPHPPIGRGLNYELSEVDEGRVVFRGSPGFDHTNPMGTVHGGWYGTLLDSAMACAVMTKVPKGSFYTTLEYKVNIVKTIPLDAPILCEGLVEHSGRSTGVARGWLRHADDGTLYATGSTTCLIMQAQT